MSILSFLGRDLSSDSSHAPGTLATTLASLSIGAGLSHSTNAQAPDAPPAIVSSVQIQTEYVTFNTLSDLVSLYRDDAKVYVHSSCVINARELSDLEADLDRDHPNWRVIFVASAASLGGPEAVRAFLDTQFSQATGFANLTDAQTGLKNGAYFARVIDGDERRIFYKGMEHYDRYVSQDDFAVGKVGDPPARILIEDPYAFIPAARAAIKSVEGAVANGAFWETALPVGLGGGALGLGLLSTGAVLAVRRRRTRNAVENATAELEAVTRACAEKSEARTHLMVKVGEVFDTPIPETTRYEGKTKEAATRVGELVRSLLTYERVLEEKVLPTATKLLRETGRYSSAGPLAAIEALTTRKFAFDPKSDLRQAMMGEGMDRDDALLAHPDAFKKWEASCNDIFESYSRDAKELLTLVESVAQARATTMERSLAAQSALQSAVGTYSTLANDNSESAMLDLPPFPDSAASALRTSIDDNIALAISDPIAASAALEQLHSRAATWQELTKAITEALRTSIPSDSELTLPDSVASGVTTRELISQAFANDTSEILREIRDRILVARTLAAKYTALSSERAAIEDTLASFRDIQGRTLGIDPKTVLVETLTIDDNPEDLNPSTHLLSATAQLELCRHHLDDQDVAVAFKSFELADEAVVRARELLESAMEIAEPEMHDQVTQRHQEELTKRLAIKDEATRALAALRTFDSELLRIPTVDPEDPRADLDLGNNAEEVKEALELAGKALAQAEEFFRSGKFNSALHCWDIAEEHYSTIDHRTNQLTALLEEVETADRSNRERINRLQLQGATIAPKAERHETSAKTLETFVCLAEALGALAPQLSRPERNPLSIAKTLSDFEDQARLITSRIEDDSRTYQEAIKRLNQTDTALATFKRDVQRTSQDQYSDDPKLLTTWREQIEKAEAELVSLRENIGRPHPDSAAIDCAADKLIELCVNGSRLVARELSRAEEASKSLSEASSAISALKDLKDRAVRNPSQFYALTPNDRAGSEFLHRARDAHFGGDHAEADRLADEAKAKAAAEARDFEARVERKAREARRVAAERAREAREAADAIGRAIVTAAVLSSRSSSTSSSNGVSYPRTTSRPVSRPSSPSPSRPSTGRSSGTASRSTSAGRSSGTASRSV